MRCSKVRRKLTAYADGECDETTAGAVEAHLTHCSGCRAELEEQRQLSQELALISAPEPGDDSEFIRRVMAGIDAGESRPTFGMRVRQALLAAAATALTVVGMFLGVQLGAGIFTSPNDAGVSSSSGTDLLLAETQDTSLESLLSDVFFED